MRVSFYFFLFLTAYGAMEANPVARGYGLSARTACSVGAFWLRWGCRVCMYVCVFFVVAGAWAPMSIPGERSIAPLGGSLSPPAQECPAGFPLGEPQRTTLPSPTVACYMRAGHRVWMD